MAPRRRTTGLFGSPKRKSPAKRGSAKKRRSHRAVLGVEKGVRKAVRFAFWGK